MSKKRNIKVYVTDAEYEAIAEIAENENTSMSKLLRNCVLGDDSSDPEQNDTPIDEKQTSTFVFNEDSKEWVPNPDRENAFVFDDFANKWIPNPKFIDHSQKGPAIAPSSARA